MNYIIGSGISGLTAAYHLQKMGKKTVVKESTEKVGGRIKTNGDFGHQINVGAQYLAEKDFETLRLINEIGLRSKLMKQNLHYSYVKDGKILKAPNEILMHITLEEKIQVMRFYFDWILRPSLFWANQLELTKEVDFKKWYNRHYGKESLWFFDSIIRGTTSPGSDEMSAYNGINLLQAMLSTPYNFENGLTELTEHLKNKAGIRIDVNCRLKEIRTNNNHIKEIEFEDKTVVTKVENCVLSTPATEVRKLVDNAEYKLLDKVEYTSAMYVLVELSKPLVDNDSHFIFADPAFPIATLLNRSHHGKIMYGALMPMQKKHENNNKNVQKVVENCLSEMNPEFDRLKLLKVERWKNALPKLSPELHDVQKRISQLPIANLHLIGDYTEIPSIEGAIISAKKLASKL